MDGIGVEHVIRLTDSGPWGFRLGGGDDFGCPLQVAKVCINKMLCIVKTYPRKCTCSSVCTQLKSDQI